MLGLPHSQCIVDSQDRSELLLFLKGHLQPTYIAVSYRQALACRYRCEKGYWKSLTYCLSVCGISQQTEMRSLHQNIWLLHGTEMISALQTLGKGNQPVTRELPSQKVCKADLWYFSCSKARIKLWSNMYSGWSCHHILLDIQNISSALMEFMYQALMCKWLATVALKNIFLSIPAHVMKGSCETQEN